MKINFEKLKKLSGTGLVLIMLSSPVNASGDKIHFVSKGENLGKISHMYYGTNDYYDELATYNNKKDADMIKIGEVIYIPTLKELLNVSNYSYGYLEMKKGDTLYKKCKELYGDGSLYSYVAEYNDITDYNNIQIGTLIYFPSLKELLDYKNACNCNEEGSHIVKKGETLSRISYIYYGNTSYYKEIGDYNGITDYDNIIVGTVLYIPNVKTKILTN